jgi:hypothetical protein
MRRLALVIAGVAVVAAVIAAFVLGGGGDSANVIGDGGASGGSAAPPPPPATAGGGGGAGAAPPPPVAQVPTSRLQEFRSKLRKGCKKAGTAVAISAGTESGKPREREMADEVRYLKRLRDAIAGVRAPTDKMRRDLAAYRLRLNAQIKLDGLIKLAAHGEDDRSVQVGMDQNAHNRDARTEAADALGVDCLKAAAPR